MKSDIEQLYEKIGECLKDKWGDDTTNKLSLTCLYSLNIFSNEDIIYWKTAILVDKMINSIYDKGLSINNHINNINNISDINDINDMSFTKVITAIYCILASNQTIYNLPSMLNLNLYHGKITTHILFGDALANLSSITLVAESYKLLLELDTPINKCELIGVLNEQTSNFRATSKLINKFPKSTKELIKNDYQSFQITLLENTIITILILRSYSIDNILAAKKTIRQIAKELMSLIKTRNPYLIKDEEYIEIFTRYELLSLIYSTKVEK